MNRNGNPHRIVKLRVRGWNVDHIHRTAYLMVQGAFVKPLLRERRVIRFFC